MTHTEIRTLQARRWDLSDLPASEGSGLLGLLERGGVICLPQLPAPAGSEGLLDTRWADPRSKNISFDEQRGLKGALGDAAIQAQMSGLLRDFRAQALALVQAIAPDYSPALRIAPASLRLLQVQGRASSWRKDDSRLHIDAFPSRPNYGERILRVFHNLNPHQQPRVWRVGEPFEALARRFVPRLPRYSPARAQALHWLHATKQRRSEYDHLMVHLHDAMKADLAYQADCPQQTIAFAPGCTWVCYSDQASHAVMSGQFMLEQTLHLPVQAMHEPACSPLRVLESLCGHALV